MPIHKQRKHLPYTEAQLFALVSDMEQYPKFLPWCTGIRIRKIEPGTNPHGQPCQIATVDMSVRFKIFRETFTTRTMLDPEHHTIIIDYLDGPFKHLENKWHFESVEDGAIVDFFIDFEFRSRPLQSLIGTMFEHALEKMMRAFEERAAEVYGPGVAD